MSADATSFLDLLRRQRAELEQARSDIDKQIDDVDVAIRVAQRLAVRPSGSSVSHTTDTPITGIPPSTPTQPDMIINTLRASADVWMPSASALHEAVKAIYGVEIKESSFHPVLYTLKKRGKVLRDGSRIALTERLTPEERALYEAKADSVGTAVADAIEKEVRQLMGEPTP